MRTINQFEFCGKVAAVPTVTQSKNGTTYATFYINVPFGENNKYYEITAFKETVNEVRTLLKDDEVLIKGYIQSNEYTDRNNQRRVSCSLIANNVFKGTFQAPQAQQQYQAPQGTADLGLTKEDLPF